MRRIHRMIATFMVAVTLTLSPTPVRADFWGGDLPLLAQIVFNTLQQLAQLRHILSAGRDTLGLIRDINEGIREAMGIMRTMNQTIRPGVFSEYQTPEQILRALQDLYGTIPRTSEAKMQGHMDQSVAEAVTLHNEAFKYADQIDPEAERIKEYSRGTSPAGSARLTAQALGVLIHVSNQVLRTNAAILKIMSENLALQNRHEKLNSEQFKMQYEGLSTAISTSASMKDALELKHGNP